MRRTYFSFVVDNLPLHYYQAELLLHSLQHNANVDKDQIIVQCLNRVEQSFITFLKRHGYHYRVIEPYLDGKYCNKLQQLDYFLDKSEIEAVVLLDTDMYILDKLEFEKEIFQAKIVDAPNPTLQTLKNIYTVANLPTPNECSTDWNIEPNTTFENNFNGGLYYIPAEDIATIEHSWKKWATWLMNKEALFEKKQQMIHIDQISIGMALVEHGIAYKHLTANYNAPIHFDRTLSSLKTALPIKILHYHRELNRFGYINDGKVTHPHLQEAIAQANHQIASIANSFYEHYVEKSVVLKDTLTKALEEFTESLERFVQKERRLNLILHAGTPKTGTTTLQFFLDANATMLQEQGFLYPKEYLNTPAPKHQWLVSYLRNDHIEKFAKKLETIYKTATETEDIHTIILSTEGIYNHWWDYSDQAKLILKRLNRYFNLSIVVYFREPLSFVDSLYRQYLKNPKMKDIAPYGKNLTFAQMYEIEWFRDHLDYLGFIKQCEYLVGKERVHAIAYSNEIVEKFCKVVGIPYSKERIKTIARKNKAHSDAVVEILKYINQYDLSIKEKQTVVNTLSILDETLSQYSEKRNYSIDMKEEIENLTAKQRSILNERYHISFEK